MDDLSLILRLVAASVMKRQHHTLLNELAHLRAENAFYRQQLPAKRFSFTVAWRRRFAETGVAVGWARLKRICTVASVRTIQRWRSEFKKGLPSLPRTKRGRPRTPAEIEQLIIRFATENTGWGIHRISGELRKLKVYRDPTTVSDILKRNGIEPLDPQRRGRESTWKPFIVGHAHEIVATDFFTADIWGWLGKQTVYVLFAIHVATRKVEILGVTKHPDEAFMKQIARNCTMADVGWFKQVGAKYLIHDHDTKFCESFKTLLGSEGVEAIKLPPNSPNLNAFAERWVKSIKTDCLRKITCLGYGGLRRALREYLTFYHQHRPHQSLGNEPPEAQPAVGKIDAGAAMGKISCIESCGGVLKHYCREAA